MKKYMFCFLLFAAVSVICFLAGFLITRDTVRPEEAIPNVTVEMETAADDHVVMKQEQAEPVAGKASSNPYYLVAEDGYLLVLYKDKTTICLYTYLPLTDFPEEERGKLMEGIWFPTMLDVFSYLESYTS